MHSGTWNEEMCEKFGISMDILPVIHACHDVIGGVTEKAAKESGLAVWNSGCGRGDLMQLVGHLEYGVLNVGETQEQGGQAGGMSICTDTYKADKRLILSYHVVPNRWLLQGGTTGGGGVMRWLEREFADYEREEGKKVGKSSLELFNEIAEKVAPGSDGVIFLPYMSGERSPIWDTNAKGIYYGLDFRKEERTFCESGNGRCGIVSAS